jgi:hypothetical protein
MGEVMGVHTDAAVAAAAAAAERSLRMVTAKERELAVPCVVGLQPLHPHLPLSPWGYSRPCYLSLPQLLTKTAHVDIYIELP